ncbi:MAG: response regulator [Chloroflexi bacterium]|nr:response regulator [Chloroflexota bacterium]
MPFKNPLYVLLIEDNPGDARLIRELLREVPSFIITHTETLADGLRAAEVNEFDAVLIDLSLPDSHGVATVLRLREALSNVPLVVLTGSQDEQLGIEAVQAGAQDYLIKGEVDARILQRSVRYARERHQSEKAYRSLIDDVFETSMVGVLILDRGFNVVWMNEAIEVYFGVSREAIVGEDKRILIDNKLKCIFADPDDYASRLLRAYEDGSFTDRFECHVTPGDGRAERWLEHWSQPIRHGMYAGGRIEQYTDITDRKHAEFAESQQRQFAEALRSTAEALNSTLDIEVVLDRILENIDSVVPNDAANIVLLEEDELYVARSHGDEPFGADLPAKASVDLKTVPAFDTMVVTRNPICVADISQTDHLGALATSTRMRGYVGTPIVLQDDVAGFLNVFSYRAAAFEQDSADRMNAFAAQAAVAIQNARLYWRSRELAAVQERQRLARELHDSVSQTLFSAQSMAEAGLRRWAAKPEQARSLLEDVHRLLTGALAEMRILLLELRPASLTQVGLKQLFEQYLQGTLANQRIHIDFEIEDIPIFAGEAQIALYRIVQEAVNNVIKHAAASRLTVRAVTEDGRLVLSVIDDGRGFSAENSGSVSMGLGIMRERAESIGAAMRIESEAGQGTTVIVTWPMDYAEG